MFSLYHPPSSHELKLLRQEISSTASDKPSHCPVHKFVQGQELHHTPHPQSILNGQDVRI